MDKDTENKNYMEKCKLTKTATQSVTDAVLQSYTYTEYESQDQTGVRNRKGRPMRFTAK